MRTNLTDFWHDHDHTLLFHYPVLYYCTEFAIIFYRLIFSEYMIPEE